MNTADAPSAPQDALSAAIESVAAREAGDAQPPAPVAAEEGPQPIASVTVQFFADGSVNLKASGIRPALAWAGGELLRNMGDDLWHAAQAQAAAEAAARDPRRRIVDAGGRRIG